MVFKDQAVCSKRYFSFDNVSELFVELTCPWHCKARHTVLEGTLHSPNDPLLLRGAELYGRHSHTVSCPCLIVYA